VSGLARLGIDLNEVGERLSVEGVDKFTKSYEQVLGAIAAKRDELMPAAPARKKTAPAKKAMARRKPVAKKKAAARKAAVRKAVVKQKAVAKRKVARKPAAKKKATTRRK